jgi:hypothetical protein
MTTRKRETFEPVTMGHIRGHGCRHLLVYCGLALRKRTGPTAGHRRSQRPPLGRRAPAYRFPPFGTAVSNYLEPISPAPVSPWHDGARREARAPSRLQPGAKAQLVRRRDRKLAPEERPMDVPRQYRQQEVFCLRLASEASEDYVKVALTEMAMNYRHKAEDAEGRGYTKAA